MDARINKNTVYNILVDFSDILKRKEILTLNGIKFFSKIIVDFVKDPNYKTANRMIDFLKYKIKSKKIFWDTMHDLLPMMYYMTPDINIFKHLGRKYDFNYKVLYFVPYYDKKREEYAGGRYPMYPFPFDALIAFENYNLYRVPKLGESSFIFLLDNFIFQHTNVTATFNLMIDRIFTTVNVDPGLACFVYPNKIWERFEEYVDMINKDGGNLAQTLREHYSFIIPFFHVMEYIYKNPKLFNLLKKYFFYVYLNKENLFKDFNAIIGTFKDYFTEIDIIFPLRIQIYKFLYYLAKVDKDVQLKFVCKVLFLQMCPVCYSFFSLDNIGYHFDRNLKTDRFKYLHDRIPENYYVYHFLSCENCAKLWHKSLQRIHDRKQLKFTCTECYKPKLILKDYVETIDDLKAFVEQSILSVPFYKYINFTDWILFNNYPLLSLDEYFVPNRMKYTENYILSYNSPLLHQSFHDISPYFNSFANYFKAYHNICGTPSKRIVLALDASPVYSYDNEFVFPPFIETFKKSDQITILKNRIQKLEEKLQHLSNLEDDTSMTTKRDIQAEIEKIRRAIPQESFFSRYLYSVPEGGANEFYEYTAVNKDEYF